MLRVRILGTLERLANGLAKTVIEFPLVSGWKRVKPEDYVEVGGPFSGRLKARQIVWKLGGKKVKNRGGK